MSLAAVRARLEEACRSAGRDPSEVRLVVVTKGRDAAAVEREVLRHGHRELGENKVQEWRDKAAALPGDVRWHFVGHLQRNKVKYLAEGGVALVHSLDSARLADAMDAQGRRREHDFHALIEVNVSGEASKEGVDPAEVEGLLAHVARLEHVRAEGLMTMAPHTPDPERARPVFRRLRELRDRFGLRELSMGMSNDLEVAVSEGATIVRVGTSVFAGDG